LRRNYTHFTKSAETIHMRVKSIKNKKKKSIGR
jgi:hypothetical protein